VDHALKPGRNDYRLDSLIKNEGEMIDLLRKGQTTHEHDPNRYPGATLIGVFPAGAGAAAGVTGHQASLVCYW
jgi:hypothetical protein